MLLKGIERNGWKEKTLRLKNGKKNPPRTKDKTMTGPSTKETHGEANL